MLPTDIAAAGGADASDDDGGVPWWVQVLGLAVLMVAIVGGVLVVQSRNNADQLTARQAAVEQAGATVMPFDQNLTTHQFTKTDTGGVQNVTVKNPADANQIALIQSHLRTERDNFAKGDFSDPMAIHGTSMPGVADLQAGATAGKITITYDPLPDGARLTYTATTPALVDALHRWFDAQLADHGPNAVS